MARKGSGLHMEMGNTGDEEDDAPTVMEVVEKEETPGGIPWRTSRRLQEATLRIFQGRDASPANMNMLIKKEKSSPVQSCTRPLKRRSPSLEPEKNLGCEASTSGEIEGEEEKKSAVDAESNGKRRKHKKVTFGTPLCIFIGTSSSDTPSDSSPERILNPYLTKSRPPPSLEHSTRWKQPMSCFDLLCNKIGPKGWRCYRACEFGELFCTFHRNKITRNPPTRSSAIVPVCS